MIKYLILLSMFFLGSCTEQSRARQWGGDASIKLPAGKEIVTATWKNSDLWILYKKRDPKDPPETHMFVESSSWGVNEGTITLVEQ